MKDPLKLIGRITIATLIFNICIGAVLVAARVKPFFVDEWFIIYSLKTKTPAELFGQLAFMQQFPRVYLALIKYFTSVLDYSYFSIRLLPFLASCGVIILSYRLMKKMYNEAVFTRYLFILILISSFTFTEYFVEMKQYTMDILLSLLALWQLHAILSLKGVQKLKTGRYLLLCTGFLIVPFFSYTYLLAIAPAYGVLALQMITVLKSEAPAVEKRNTIVRQIIPLITGAIGISFFYMLDARQLANDKCMYDRWSFLLPGSENKFYSFCSTFYAFFSQLGSGIVYENIFGVLGILSFVYGVVSVVRDYLKKAYTTDEWLRLYSCLLLLMTFVLFLCKKLPLGTPRLNVFTIPSIAILIIYFLNSLSLKLRGGFAGKLIPVILYLGLTGNVYSCYVNLFTNPDYKKQMAIFVSTEKAIQLARDKKLPILITPGVSFPYEQATADAGAPDPAVWVLKTFPAYKMEEHLPVYAIPNMDSAGVYMKRLPDSINSVIAGDGLTYRTITGNRR